MDVRWPAGNDLDVPDLDVGLQAEGVALPVWGWGTKRQGVTHAGTWHLYVEDRRFASVLRHPELVVESGCVAAVEPNISAYDDTPMALVLAGVYRKRWVARSWQAAGVRVFVDVNLPGRVLDDGRWAAGIPRGWAAFATRGYERRLGDLDHEYAVATHLAGRAPLFLVVGGGQQTAEWCWAHPGAVHSGYASTRRPYGQGV